MNSRPLLLTMLVAGLVVSISAEENAPEGQLVGGLTPGLAWKVEALPSTQKTSVRSERERKESEVPMSSPMKVKVIEENVMGEDFRLQKIPYRPGVMQTRLFQEQIFLVLSDDGKSYSIGLPDGETRGCNVSPKRLREFDWVDRKWWVGTAMVDGVQCDIYRRPWPPEEAAKASPPTDDEPGQLAAIGRADRFPRRLEAPYLVHRYTLLPQVTPPSLPAEAVTVAREYQKKLERQAKRFQRKQ